MDLCKAKWLLIINTILINNKKKTNQSQIGPVINEPKKYPTKNRLFAIVFQIELSHTTLY